jgi:DNA polymerase III subunit delta
MEEIIKITKDIKAGNIKPIYFLMGDEPFYIDKITDFIENNILTEDEKGFNQTVLYGRDVTIEDIVGTAKRFPMMSEYQVVIVREAQELSRSIDKIESYVQNPQLSTVLVFAYKYKTLDKRKKFTKTIAEKGVLFESKKLYENQVAPWISKYLATKGYQIEPKANMMLVEFLGTDLSKVVNELEKLQIILPKGSTITPELIEKNIGISKDYNVFEFRNAIGQRDQVKAFRIAQYFARNPKENPIVLITGQLNSLFTQLLMAHGLKDKSPTNLAKSLGINPYFVKDVELSMRNYPMKKVSAIISYLRELDLKSKGVQANALSTDDLLKEVLVKIFM